MGPLFTVVILAIILLVISFVIGSLILFVGIPVFYMIKGVPKTERKFGVLKRFVILIIFTLIFVPTVLGVGLFLSHKDSNNYWQYKGAFDFFRMPLEEPYELVMIDTLDNASLGKWQESISLLWGIIRYEKRGNMVIGETSDKSFPNKNSPVTGWFIFNLTSGHIDKFSSYEALYEGAKNKGIKPPFNFKNINENWRQYWANPNRRKK